MTDANADHEHTTLEQFLYYYMVESIHCNAHSKILMVFLIALDEELRAILKKTFIGRCQILFRILHLAVIGGGAVWIFLAR